MSAEIIHKLFLKKAGAETYCGQEISALYPMTWYATLTEAGAKQIRVSIGSKGVTCEECMEKMKDGDIIGKT